MLQHLSRELHGIPFHLWSDSSNVVVEFLLQCSTLRLLKVICGCYTTIWDISLENQPGAAATASNPPPLSASLFAEKYVVLIRCVVGRRVGGLIPCVFHFYLIFFCHQTSSCADYIIGVLLRNGSGCNSPTLCCMQAGRLHVGFIQHGERLRLQRVSRLQVGVTLLIR